MQQNAPFFQTPPRLWNPFAQTIREGAPEAQNRSDSGSLLASKRPLHSHHSETSAPEESKEENPLQNAQKGKDRQVIPPGSFNTR
jgi:hypothetical protein